MYDAWESGQEVRLAYDGMSLTVVSLTGKHSAVDLPSEKPIFEQAPHNLKGRYANKEVLVASLGYYARRHDFGKLEFVAFTHLQMLYFRIYKLSIKGSLFS